MENVVCELLDLIYGELDVEEDRIRGKIVYRFISYEKKYLRSSYRYNTICEKNSCLILLEIIPKII